MQPSEEEIRKLLAQSASLGQPQPAPPLLLDTPQGKMLFLQVVLAAASDQFIAHVAAYTAAQVIKQLKEEGVIQPAQTPEPEGSEGN